MIYADNEPKSLRARDLGDCRDNEQRVKAAEHFLFDMIAVHVLLSNLGTMVNSFFHIDCVSFKDNFLNLHRFVSYPLISCRLPTGRFFLMSLHHFPCLLYLSGIIADCEKQNVVAIVVISNNVLREGIYP